MIEVTTKIKFPAKLCDDGKTCHVHCNFEWHGVFRCAHDGQKLAEFKDKPIARQECQIAARRLKND